MSLGPKCQCPLTLSWTRVSAFRGGGALHGAGPWGQVGPGPGPRFEASAGDFGLPTRRPRPDLVAYPSGRRNITFWGYSPKRGDQKIGLALVHARAVRKPILDKGLEWLGMAWNRSFWYPASVRNRRQAWFETGTSARFKVWTSRNPAGCLLLLKFDGCQSIGTRAPLLAGII